MEEGPTIGLTVIFFLCAMETISDPGSAIPGKPASDNSPIFWPFLIGFKYWEIFDLSVCLFNSKNVKSSIFVSIPAFIRNLLADRIFSTIYRKVCRNL